MTVNELGPLLALLRSQGVTHYEDGNGLVLELGQPQRLPSPDRLRAEAAAASSLPRSDIASLSLIAPAFPKDPR